MTTATFNGIVIAESDSTEIVEGNHYFPPGSVRWEHLKKTEHTTGCPWKGDASYYSVSADGQAKENAAWQYEAPFEKATHIKDHVAFYPAVTIDTK